METQDKNHDHFSNLLELTQYFVDEKVCLTYLAGQRWKDGIACPHCGHTKVYKFSDGKRFKCASCREQFTAKVGTIFEDSKIPMRKWFVAVYLHTSHKKGISSHQLARDLKITQKTAWFMLHRIRFALSQGSFNTPLKNTVEADETFIGGKNKNRHGNKKSEESQGRSLKDKTPVLGMIEREGELRAQKVSDTKSTTIQPIIENNVQKGAKVYTDEWWGYKNVQKYFDHQVIRHKAGEYVISDCHTNTIESFWSLLKRSIFGIYHHVSPAHIQSYVDESVFRYNTRKMDEGDRVNVMLFKWKEIIISNFNKS